MIPFRKCLWLVFLSWKISVTLADTNNPEFLYTSWRNEEGLPHSTINSILQTRDGYLWIGTYVGLVRFDGVRFVQYSSRDTPDLEPGGIAYLFESRDGTLWVSLENGRLVAWKEGALKIILAGNAKGHPVISMAQQRDDTVWLQTADGALGRIEGDHAVFVAQTLSNVARRNLGLVVDADDVLWVSTGADLRVWRGQTLMALKGGLSPVAGQPIEAIGRAKDGAVWIFYKQRLWKLRGEKILEQIEAPEGVTEIFGMLEVSDGRIWLGSGDGGLFCHKQGRLWDELPKAGLQGLNRVLYEDHEGNLWRGGFGSGLTRIRPRVFTTHDFPEANVDRYARTVCADSVGNVWAVLNGQILSCIPTGGQLPEASSNPTNPHAIKTMFVDHSNSLWVGADGGDVYRLRSDTFVHELGASAGIGDLNALFEDSSNNLWLGYTGGTGAGILPKGDAAKFREITGVPYADVRAIGQSADGSIWFGTHYGGAFRLRDGEWLRLTMREGLPSDYVRCFFAETDNTMWLGTLHGLCRWRNGKLAAVTSDNGLWNDSISHIAADDRGNFWISSFGGVFRVKRADLNDFADGKSKTILCVGYDHNDGLASVDCSGGFQPAGAQTSDGRLWIPTAGGLVSADLKNVRENKLPPPVWLEGFAIDDKPVAMNHSTSAVIVPPTGRRLDFRFTALSFSAPEKVLFCHKLDGLDADWSTPDKQRTVTYNYVPPGRYTFRVMACNDDGYWNERGQSLALDVQPFFWQTWWFKIGTGLALAIGLASSVRRVERWRAKVKLERLESEHAVERERNRIAKDIHDDLGANLTQIVFLSQRVEGAMHDPAEVERWNHLIPATASRTIQSLDEIVWAINPSHDTLESLANYLSRFAHEFLNLAGIRCDLDVPMVLPSLPLNAEVRHNLALSTREALQNIVSHAGATAVQVKLRLDEMGLVLEIADNGAGFPAAQADTGGNGLANMEKRLQEIGGRLEILHPPEGGTRIRLSLPRNRLHGRVVGKTVPATNR